MAVSCSPCLPCVTQLTPAPGPLHVPHGMFPSIQQHTGSLSPLGPPERPSQHSPPHHLSLHPTWLSSQRVSLSHLFHVGWCVSPPREGACLLPAETLVFSVPSLPAAPRAAPRPCRCSVSLRRPSEFRIFLGYSLVDPRRGTPQTLFVTSTLDGLVPHHVTGRFHIVTGVMGKPGLNLLAVSL